MHVAFLKATKTFEKIKFLLENLRKSFVCESFSSKNNKKAVPPAFSQSAQLDTHPIYCAVIKNFQLLLQSNSEDDCRLGKLLEPLCQ